MTASILKIKHGPEKPYVMLDKASLWDKKLSLKAVGLWARLMSRPDDWVIRVSELAVSCDLNKETIYKIINELIKEGYAYRRKIIDPETGQFLCFETYVFEVKQSEEDIQKMFPHTEKPYMGFPDAVNPDTTNIDNTNQIPKGIFKESTHTRVPATQEKKLAFGKVSLTPEELLKLHSAYGKPAIDTMIERLNEYAEIKPKRFKEYGSHAMVIRKWIRMETENKENQPWKAKKLNYQTGCTNSKPGSSERVSQELASITPEQRLKILNGSPIG
jgi:predicted transcriptional regulator